MNLVLSEPLAQPFDQQHNQAGEEHEYGNAVNTVHHTGVEIVFTLFEHCSRVEVGEDTFEEHGCGCFLES